MAIDLMEGFSAWSIASAAQEGWTTAGLVSLVAGPRASGGAIQSNNAGFNTATKTLASSGATKFFCIRASIAALGTIPFLTFREGAASHVLIGLNASAQVCAWRATTGTLLGASSETVAAGTWFQLTGKVVVHDTTGSIELRLNGSPTPILSLSGIDTRNGGAGVIDTVQLGGSAMAGSKWTDFAVWNESGESPTGWVGDVRVDVYLPSGAGSSTQFTPSAGANYACVGEAIADGDTSYVESATNGHLDLYAIGNMTHTPSQIHAVGVTALAKKTDAGSGSLKLKLKSGATTDESSATALSDGSYSRLSYYRGIDPATDGAWTKAGVDALEAGIEAVI